MTRRFGLPGARRALPALPLAVVMLLFGSPTGAGPRLYSLEIPESRAVTYELPLEIRHAGQLFIRAEWSGPRTLALRLDRPERFTAVARRWGTSPLEMKIEIEPDRLGEEDWTLTVHSIAGKGDGSGVITVELPVEESDSPPPPPPVVRQPEETEPWMVARSAPPGSPPSRTDLYRAVERFRASLADPSAPPVADSCRWQESLMRYLAERRDELADGGAAPSDSTRRFMRRMADSIRLVDQMRISADPLIAGPAPEDPRQRKVWLKLRRERLHPLVAELDNMFEALRRGHAPDLADQEWPSRLAICLTACQRHFEERVRIGKERAINRDLARNQWDRMLAAEGALRALSDL